MEAWRIIATALLVAGGVVLVLLTMAKVREHGSGGTNGQVALSGVISLVVLIILSVLTATVLPAWLVWALVVAVGVIVSVGVLAS